jgi:hypothetical protein
LSNFKKFKNVLHGARILLSALIAIGLAVRENKVAGEKKTIAMAPTISCHSGTPPRSAACILLPTGRRRDEWTSGGRRCYLAVDPI